MHLTAVSNIGTPGTCTWEDGRRYEGEWRNGMAHGMGKETYPNGKVRHEGQWIDDEPIRD